MHTVKVYHEEGSFFQHLKECCHRCQHFSSSGTVVIPWTILKTAVLGIEPSKYMGDKCFSTEIHLVMRHSLTMSLKLALDALCSPGCLKTIISLLPPLIHTKLKFSCCWVFVVVVAFVLFFLNSSQRGNQ